jgi:hypothetical protein
MSCLGVHFAVTAAEAGALWDLAQAERDDEVLAFVEALEERWDTEHLQETDKAWDAIHRCLADGTLDYLGGEWPLNGAVLGEESLYSGTDYIVRYLTDEDVQQVADALDGVAQPWFRDRFSRLAAHGYGGRLDEDEFDYTWHWFELLRAFFRKTADEGRHLVFTADQ